MDFDRTDTYDYDLPADLIADAPAENRPDSRLMLGGATGPQHRTFSDLPEILRAGDLLVFNDTRVVPARVHTFKPTGGAVELFMTDVVSLTGEDRWTTPTAGDIEFACMTRSSKKVRPGVRLTAGNYTFRVLEAEAGHARVAVAAAGSTAVELLETLGEIPLPPYIVRRRDELGEPTLRPSDVARYQTVYAQRPGAVAAPTAGLHFDQPLLNELRDRGIRQATLTLDVGPGTFRPVTTERLSEHAMHTESYRANAALGDAIAQTRAHGGRVIAVGTTSVRALEAEARCDDPFSGAERATDIFISPGFEFAIVDAMITNFHLPCSTLLALVYAFGGPERVRQMYRTAVEQRYRFYSYGDAMFLTRSS